MFCSVLLSFVHASIENHIDWFLEFLVHQNENQLKLRNQYFQCIYNQPKHNISWSFMKHHFTTLAVNRSYERQALTSNSAQARFTDSARQRSASNDCSSCRRTMWPQCWIRSSGCWTNSWATGGRSVRSCCRRWRAVRRRADNTPQSSSSSKPPTRSPWSRARPSAGKTRPYRVTLTRHYGYLFISNLLWRCMCDGL